jgi:hypothetical protein
MESLRSKSLDERHSLISTVILTAAMHQGHTMGILDLFRENKDEVQGTRVLVCAVDDRFDDLLKEDSEVYGRYYRATTTAVLPSIQVLLGRLEQKFDIVHLIADLTETGTIRDASGREITATELIQRCCDHDVKLLWAASDNPPERYLNGFGARGKRLNLVLTLKRKGSNFPSFLRKILSRIAYGDTMPVAWNEICPQIPGSEHKDAPESIFFAGRGGVRLLP